MPATPTLLLAPAASVFAGALLLVVLLLSLSYQGDVTSLLHAPLTVGTAPRREV